MRKIVYYQGDEVVDVKNILTDVGDIAVAVLDGEEIMHIRSSYKDDDITVIYASDLANKYCYIGADVDASIRKNDDVGVKEQKPFTCPRCGGNTYSVRNGIIKCDYCDTEFIQFDAGEVARNDMASATWNFPPIATSYERY